MPAFRKDPSTDIIRDEEVVGLKSRHPDSKKTHVRTPLLRGPDVVSGRCIEIKGGAKAANAARTRRSRSLLGGVAVDGRGWSCPAGADER